MIDENELRKILLSTIKRYPPIKILAYYTSATEFIPDPLLNPPKKTFIPDKIIHQVKK